MVSVHRVNDQPQMLGAMQMTNRCRNRLQRRLTHRARARGGGRVVEARACVLSAYNDGPRQGERAKVEWE